MRRILGSYFSVGYLLVLAVLVLDAALVTSSLRTIAESNRLVDHTREVLVELEHALSVLKDAETGQRGFLLTGQEAYLDPFRLAESRLGPTLGKLQSLVSDSRDQAPRAAELTRLAEEKMAELRQTIERARSGDRPGALRIVETDRGRRVMAEARRLASDLGVEENRLLLDRVAASRSAVTRTVVTFAATTAAGFFLLLAVAYLHRREILVRDRAARELASSEAWLSTTLTSVGDALIATDEAGRVRFMNPVAEALTGWSQAEAVGRPMDDVFEIVNETTRRTAENPVSRVLREGVVVGLANHTVLIGRDGRETPIEDSAAPIRGERGEVSGVVMVFRDVTGERASRMALEESEARKAAVLESAIDAIITIDREGRVVETNPAAASIFGVGREALVGRDLCDAIVAPDQRERWRAELARFLATGDGPLHGGRVEVAAAGSDGAEFPIELAVSRISSAGPPMFTAYARDIRERKRAEARRVARLRVTEALATSAAIAQAAPAILRALGEALGWEVGLLWLVDTEAGVMRCRELWHASSRTDGLFEETCRAFTPARGDGLPGRIWASRSPTWIPDVAADALYPRAPIAAREGLHGAFGFPILAGDEVLGEIEFFSAAVRDPDPDLLEMVGTIGCQIGQALKRSRAEADFRAEQERLRLALEAGGMGTWDWHIPSGRVDWSAGLEAIHGLEAGTFPGTLEAARRDIHPDDRERVSGIVTRAVEGEGEHRVEYRLLLPDGSIRWIEARGALFRDDAGAPERMVGVCIDITERKRAERERMRLISIIEHSPDFIGLADVDRRVSFINRAGRRLIGLDGDGADRATSLLDYFAEDERPRVEREVLPALAESGRWDGEVQFANAKTGARVPVLWNVFALPDPDTGHASYFASVSRDITERKRAEGRLEFLAAAGTTLASSFDFRATFTEIARLATAEFADLCVIDLAIDEGDRVERVACVHADPNEADASARLARFVPSRHDERHPVGRTLATGQSESVLAIDDAWMRQAATSAEHLDALRGLDLSSLICVPIPSRDRVAGAMTFGLVGGRRSFDNSDVKLAQDLGRRAGVALHNALLYREAEEANRAKSQFLAVLSHELRTPLNPILLAVTSMLERPTAVEDVRPNLEMIRQYVNLQARLIDDLLDVMRIVRGKMPLHWEVADCHALIKQAVQICQSEVFGKRLRLELELNAAHHHINTDPARLQQVFWNLIKNAVKFTSHGLITIRTRNEAGPDGSEESLIVEVSDTGIGIEPDALARIFDPFQQAETSITRRFGGLGLGLAISKGIVEGHGGTLVAESQGKDRGTTFRLTLRTLPEIQGDASHPSDASADPDTPAPSRSRRILLVEDEQATLRLMARLLRGLGHEVTTANSISAALETERSGEYDLIISDIGLPDGSGLDLMRQVVSRRGPVAAIALTGYGMEEDIQRSRDAGFTAHMTKPIDFTKLEAMIRQVAS